MFPDSRTFFSRNHYEDGRLRFEAHLAVLARILVTKSGSFSETVEVAFTSLPFAVEGNKSILEAHGTKPVRVTVHLRSTISPCL
jgi:hypothetical protein